MEKIKKIKKFLKEENIQGYIIPKNDMFFNEYTDESEDRLKYISNFSGSFGFALILENKNFLFVDGRYTLQANNESSKYFQIQTIPKQMPHNVLKRKKISVGFDPNLFTKKFFKIFFSKTKISFIPINRNLIDKVWKRKKIDSKSNFYFLPSKAFNETSDAKLDKVLFNLKKNNADYQLITSSENNAWLFNIRGKDTKYCPLPNCYSLVDRKRNIYFFCNLKKITKSFKKKFPKFNFINIDSISKILSKIEDKKFIIDESTCSILLENNILKKNIILLKTDPIYSLKSIKSKKEIQNIKKIHIYDGVALTKYLFWVKKNYKKKKITEISGEKKLLNFRKQFKEFKFSSFPTISGVGPNGAIIHYRASDKSCRRLRKGEIYLIDSGGQYNFGTTDVTRTISLGGETKRIKNIFTRVLKGHLAVSNFRLSKKTNGSIIDRVARKYLSQIKLDYAHGTGHGVGYFLNVHEGPQAISKNNKVVFKVGMIVSNEPGYYEKNKFGIRIENLIYVKKIKGKIMFDDLTMAPIDKDLIDLNILNLNEKKWLNSYHAKVFKNLKVYMKSKDLVDLEKACSAI